MKRRNFLVALLALPFAGKVLKAEPWVPKSAKRSPEEWRQFIESEVANRMAELNRELFDSHRFRIAQSAYWVRKNTEALVQYAPTGFKKK